MFRIAIFALAAVLSSAATLPARANDAAEFMARFSGEWAGAGELLVGPETGLRFNCDLSGVPSRTQLTFAMKGRCFLGALSAPVHARMRYNAETNRFYGEFLDGAQGAGLDIVGARAGDGFSLQLVRGAAQGRLTAEAVTPDELRIVMFYRDRANNRELPVAAMEFARKGSQTFGSLD